MKTRTLIVLLCSLLPVVTTVAFANEAQGGVVDIAAPFALQAQRIRNDLAGDAYSELGKEDRRSVDAALTRMGATLVEGVDINRLSEAEKVQLFNDQELVNTLLTRARADSRVVCKREKTVGSHRAVSQCLTVAERRRLREESSELLQANQRALSKPELD